MKILVAGGAGFIGSHLCDRLIEEGEEVICVDNLYTGRISNIQHLFNDPRFEFLEADIVNVNFVDLFYEKVNQIYNLACPASPRHYQKDPIYTMLVNVIGTKNLLDLANRDKATFLQASTSEVYGDPLEHPQKETYRGNVNSTGPRACYDEGKRAAECLIVDYLRCFKTDVKIVRIFNTYGPRLSTDDGRVVSNFIIQCLKNEPITIYGNGQQTRSFCYVSDMVEGLIKLMNYEDFLLVNLGNPVECTILELSKLIKKLTSSESKYLLEDLPIDDPVKRRPNINRAKSMLSWEPKVSLEQGLIKTIEYFKKEKI